jgi:catechol-2,3-dioxygenase
MKLSWSHAVLMVRNEGLMLDFYTNVLGFQVTDRGPLEEGTPDVIFLSQDPEEHHQLGMAAFRQDEGPSNTVHHFAFRVEAFEDVRELARKLKPIEGIEIQPLTHGNALSVYFNDPEGNGLEVFWDTPWHVKQPMARPWDISMNEEQALDWIKSEFGEAPEFGPVENYHERRRAELGLD